MHRKAEHANNVDIWLQSAALKKTELLAPTTALCSTQKHFFLDSNADFICL